MKNLLFTLFMVAILFGCQSKKTFQKANTGQTVVTCSPAVKELDFQPGKEGKLAPLFEGLDVYHYPVSTTSKIGLLLHKTPWMVLLKILLPLL